MILGGATTLDGGIKAMQSLRSYAPFRYSGRWHIAAIGSTCYAFRTMAPLMKRAAQAGVDRLEYATIQPQQQGG